MSSRLVLQKRDCIKEITQGLGIQLAESCLTCMMPWHLKMWLCGYVVLKTIQPGIGAVTCSACGRRGGRRIRSSRPSSATQGVKARLDYMRSCLKQQQRR